MSVIKNNKAYDSVDVRTMLNKVPTKFTLIDYGMEQEHQNNHEIGSKKPSSWSVGKESYYCNLQMLMAASVKIEDSVPTGKSVLDIKPFEINVTFVNEYQKVVNDTLVLKFATFGRAVNGEMGLEQQYTMHVLDIIPNNV